MLVTIWFLLWTLLWAVYFILDGFDLGSGTLMPFLARNDTEKRYIYNASGPFWDGNEVWLITAGGVTFAAFPLAYATMFSALYAPLLILLFALIFRAAAFEFRSPTAGGDSGIYAWFWATFCPRCCWAWPSPTCSGAFPSTPTAYITAPFLPCSILTGWRAACCLC